jgi:hypothetical protein
MDECNAALFPPSHQGISTCAFSQLGQGFLPCATLAANEQV